MQFLFWFPNVDWDHESIYCLLRRKISLGLTCLIKCNWSFTDWPNFPFRVKGNAFKKGDTIYETEKHRADAASPTCSKITLFW